MTLFLTSSPCDNNVPEGLDLPCIFDARNGFVENLRASVEPGAQLLIIASDPDAFAGNDEMAATFEGCFAAAEIELEDVCGRACRAKRRNPALRRACTDRKRLFRVDGLA